MVFLYIRFTYWIDDNQQEYSRLGNWFSLWCLVPWMNHLPPIRWSTSFMFVKWQFVCKFGIVEKDFLLISCLHSCFCTAPKFCLLFFLSNVLFTLKYIFQYFVLLYSINVVSTFSCLIPTWISNYMNIKVWLDIAYLFPNSIGSIVEIWQWISNFIPYLWYMWLLG